jgi:aspartate carbamoyltransferase catalytic subunit
MTHGTSLSGLRDLDRASIEVILDRAEHWLPRMQQGTAIPVNRAVVGLMFLEDSTRTRCSFETAVHRLGHAPVVLSGRGSSTSKGESLRDTAANLAAMGLQALVVRCSQSGGPRIVQEATGLPVINAGDGRHEHPTQALLDLSTLRSRLGSLEGRRILIVGDVLNSRVARSNVHGLTALGAQILLVGPASLVPWRLADQSPAVTIAHDLDAVMDSADAVMMLRIQRERDAGRSVSADYRQAFGMTRERVARLAPEVPILHPGPVNRGVELDDEVLDDPDRSVVLDQVRRGVAVRMAVLERALAAGGGIN